VSEYEYATEEYYEDEVNKPIQAKALEAEEVTAVPVPETKKSQPALDPYNKFLRWTDE
jgi:hypothetical protein